MSLSLWPEENPPSPSPLASPLAAQTWKYPPTRYMGSKHKLLPAIWNVISQFAFETAADLFSGSGIVSYMLKAQGKQVTSNDYMAMSATFAKALIENNQVTLSAADAEALMEVREPGDHFVQNTFKDLYFPDEDNLLIDTIRANIRTLSDPYQQAIATSALIRACMKKRPRGIFTYVGYRYDDGRKDLQVSLRDQFLEAVRVINRAVFDNHKKNQARHGDALALDIDQPDLIYLDPPYYSPYSDNEYVRRYHFVEGLARNWEGVDIQQHTLTKKFKSYPTLFASRKGAAAAFEQLFQRFRYSILIVSYSSNSLPTLDEMVAMMSRHKARVEVVKIDHRYSFGTHAHRIKDNKNAVHEYLFTGF